MGYEGRISQPDMPAPARPADAGAIGPRWPHPSWHEALAGSAPGAGHGRPITDAGEFWQRLGI